MAEQREKQAINSSSSPENQTSFLDEETSRRNFLKGAFRLGLGGLAAITLPACMRTGAEPEPSEEERAAAAPPTEVPQEIKQWLANGKYLRSEQDQQMLDNTIPGIDLAYFQNRAVAAIRQIQDSREEITTAIGFLGVEENERYNYYNERGVRVYTCNVYALDLLRLLLGNDVIGSRYDESTGRPMVLGMSQLRQMTNENLKAFNRQYKALDSNNLDQWMRNHGINYEWERVNAQQELQQKLNNGYVGLAATNYDIVEKKRAELEEDERFYGHALVNLAVSNQLLGISQSTNNIRLKAFPLGSDHPKVDPERINQEHGVPEMSFWVHKLP